MSAMDDFFDWCDYNDIRANTNHKLDWAFLDFMHDVYEANNGGGRAKVTQAMAGLQLFAPQLKGKLKLSAQALLGWKKRHPGKRHPPLTWHLTLAIASQLTKWGRFDMAVATLLAFVCLLRIGEFVNLRVEDILDADSRDVRFDTALRSGLRLRSTKTADNLFAELHNKDVLKLLRMVVRGKSRDDRVFDFSASSFRDWFKRAVFSLGLDQRYVPHSLRHGGATALYMRGVSLETILHMGRWASMKSARYYVQSGEAILLGMKPAVEAFAMGFIVDMDVFGTLSSLKLQHAVKARAPSNARSRARRQPAQAQHTAPSRHSSRHDWKVKPDYTALDDGTIALLSSWWR
jgi:integrase